MLTIGVSVISILMVAVAVLVVMNRESEKIVGAAIPLALASCSLLTLIFVFARLEPISRVFPVSFSFYVADKFPKHIPYRPILPQSHFLFDRILKRNAKALEEQPDEGGVLVYHEFLQKALVDWIASRHSQHWHMEILTFEGPGTGPEEHFRPLPDAKGERAKVLSVEDLQGIFAGNRFASVHMPPGSLALPLDTTLNVETPKEALATGQIRFKNSYCEITMKTSYSRGEQGLGAYSMLLGLPTSAREEYWSQQYIVRIDAKFTSWFVGHPKMGPIKQWATGIVNGLQNAFDEQVIWRKTLETYTLSQHLPPEPPRGR